VVVNLNNSDGIERMSGEDHKDKTTARFRLQTRLVQKFSVFHDTNS
jgi:hypothetical protein